MHAAQAHWLDGALLQWSGQTDRVSGHTYSLLASRQSRLQVQAGRPAEGVEQRWPLSTVTGTASSAVRQRFAFIKPGLLLQMPDVPAATLRELHEQQTLLVEEDKQGRVVAATRLQIAGALDARPTSPPIHQELIR